MMDFILVLAGLLLSITLAAAFIYYRRLRDVREEYIDAKEVVGDIVVSFNRQLNRQVEGISAVNRKAETAYLRSDVLERKFADLEKKVESLESSLEEFKKQVKEGLIKAFEGEKKLKELENKVKELEETGYRVVFEGEEGEVRDAAPASTMPIPIKRDRIFSSLTSTELTVLEILAKEGPKTAPQIRDRIKLTREHTARLMKKLYEKGFLERDTSKIPYSYRIKEEMVNLLERKETLE